MLQAGPDGEWDEELLVVLLHVLHGGGHEAEAGRSVLAVLVLAAFLRLASEPIQQKITIG